MLDWNVETKKNVETDENRYGQNLSKYKKRKREENGYCNKFLGGYSLLNAFEVK